MLTDDTGVVRLHRAAGGPLHADGVEVRIRLALVRPAPAAAGRHAAAARRRPAAEGHRVPACRAAASSRATCSTRTATPMPGVMVRVMRYQYQQGERRLTPAGTAQTDDQGQYRVWGLMPGDYYVNAIARGGGPGGGPFGGPGGPGGPAGSAAAAGGRGGRGGRRGGWRRPGAGQLRADLLSRRPVGERGEAGHRRPEPGSARHQLQPAARARRRASAARRRTPTARRSTSGNVNLMPDAGGGRGGQIGMNFGGRIQWDGAFTIGNVPPGRYIAARARRRRRDAAVRGAAAQRRRRRRRRRDRRAGGGRDDHRHGVVPARRHRRRPTSRRSASRRRRPISRTSARSRTRASTRTGTSRSAACRPART